VWWGCGVATYPTRKTVSVTWRCTAAPRHAALNLASSTISHLLFAGLKVTPHRPCPGPRPLADCFPLLCSCCGVAAPPLLLARLNVGKPLYLLQGPVDFESRVGISGAAEDAASSAEVRLLLGFSGQDSSEWVTCSVGCILSPS